MIFKFISNLQYNKSTPTEQSITRKKIYISQVKMSLRRKLILLFSTVLFVSVLPTLAIVNEGNETIETPWLVFISKNTNNQENATTSEKKICTGALIDAQIVLATATCLHMNLEETKNLIVEAYNQSRQVSQVNLREFNPQYFLHNDYAVLKLSEPFLLSSRLSTIALPSVNEYIDIPKCQQLTYNAKSSGNKTMSKVMGRILFSQYQLCQQDMTQLHTTYQKPNIIWHPSVLCSIRLPVLKCIEMKDWSSIAVCPLYYEPKTPLLAGFQQTFLVFDEIPTKQNSTAGTDDCIMVYSNLFHASYWIKQQIDDILKK